MDSDDARAIVITGLKQLADADLLVPELDNSQFALTALSRRAMVAGASVVAPMITSMLAPTPAAAKSAPGKIDVDSKSPNEKGEKDKGNKGRKW